MKIKDFSQVDVTAFFSQLMEILIDYNGGTQPVYIGYNNTPSADPGSETWFIVKLSYTGGNMTHQQLGSLGRQFAYSWTNRATYF